MLIKGKEIEYLYVCIRKLWLFHHGIRPEMENQNVQIGMLIGETTFSRHEKEIALGEIGVIDWAEFKHGRIHETKKSKCPGDAEIAQTRYYLWWLRENGANIDTCIIHYPKQKITKELKWDDLMSEDVENDLKRAREIIGLTSPPEFKELKYCRSCAYFEFCIC